MSGCRIGRIKLKAGGTVYPMPVTPRDEAQQDIMRASSLIAGDFAPGEIGGFVVMAWDKNGQWLMHYSFLEDCFVGPTLAPSFVADALRRELISDGFWSD